MFKPVILFLIAFLIGGIPTGYIFVRLKEHKDIRTLGSGNIGFTNVLRASGLTAGLIVLIIDVGKAFLTVYFFSNMMGNVELYRLLFGLSVILGNLFSPYLKFKGGKGVATGLGVSIAISPYAIIIAVIIFLIVFFIFRYVSLGSISAAFIFMATNIFLYYKFGDIYTLIFSILLFIAVIVSHRENIKRLIRGTENKIGSRKK